MWILPLLVPLCLPHAPAPQAPAPRAVPQAAPSAQRMEAFVFFAAQGDTETSLGMAEWRRRELPSGAQLELVVEFPEEEYTSWHVEYLAQPAARTVVRERTPEGGRSLLAEWGPDGRRLKLSEWGPEGRRLSQLVTTDGAIMPLYLVELLREGRLGAGPVHRFDPASRRIEELEVLLVEGREDRTMRRAREAGAPASQPPSDETRVYELRRLDGSLAGRFRFRGTELRELRWQSGGIVARRVTAEELEEVRAEFLQRREEKLDLRAGE